MNESPLRVTSEEFAEDRFHRFRLLSWWDQQRIRAAKVLVVGAGALGNEILKNLALLGFERVVVVDVDSVELSNLSRSVLFRASDIGRPKAEAAAAAYRELYQPARVQPLRANIVSGIGLGLFDWADVILAGLDNREARLWINRIAWKMARPWIDGAIEGLNGVARVFLPSQAPCYECTLGETDWAILERRMSCNLLTREDQDSGKVPTTPTTSSVIAGIQVQEALKLIHGLPVLAGKAFIFDGVYHTSYVVEYTPNPECLSHYTHQNVVRLSERSRDLTLCGLLCRARQDFRSDKATLEFSRDVIHKLACAACGAEEEVFVPLGTLSQERARCADDGSIRRVVAVHGFDGSEAYGSRSLDALGLPLWDVYTARCGAEETAYLTAGDATAVLGPLRDNA